MIVSARTILDHLSFSVASLAGSSGVAAKLIQPYKVATWDTMKDPDGFYWGDYYGTMCFEVNTDVVKNVPQDWSDLLKPEYKGMVGIGDDPAAASQAQMAVWAAGLANGGSLDDVKPGLDFFKKVAAAGNLNGAVVQAGLVAKGEIPVAIRWDFNSLSSRDQAKKDNSANITVVYPSCSDPHPCVPNSQRIKHKTDNDQKFVIG